MWNSFCHMGNSHHQELPEVDPGPTPYELINEVFAEAGRQKIKLVNMGSSIGWDVQKLARVKRGAYTPKLDEYQTLCQAVGKSPRQIEDMARFHSTCV